MLSDFVCEHVQMIRDALGILRFLEMPRRARAELEARGESLKTQHVFECEDRACFGCM
jgi:hypothetical protein